MRSYLFLFILCLSSSLWTNSPNVLIILVDDLGFSDLGCYGATQIQTPNLDQLARGGIKYKQFYNTGRCWPTRASLMTGKYPHEVNHAFKFGSKAPKGYQGISRQDGPFISEMLKSKNYRSYHVGKWHLNSSKGGKYHTLPLGRGFDRSYCIERQDNFFNPVRIRDEHHLVHRPGDDQPYYMTTALTDRTIHYLEEHHAYHQDKPFFLYLAHPAPHFPLHALPEDIARYKGKFMMGWEELRHQRLERLKSLKLVNPSMRLPEQDEDALDWNSLSQQDKEMWDERMAIHAAMVHAVDRGVGRIITKLKQIKEYKDTLILFLSDNGASAEYIVRGDGHDRKAPAGSEKSYLCLEVSWANACNTPFRLHKMWTHEGGISTPMIAHWPNGIQEPNRISEHMGHVIDIFPTIEELAQVKDANQVTGKSFLNSFKKTPLKSRHDFLFFEHTGNKALREANWKLVMRDGYEWELFKMDLNRNETHNLIEQYPEKAKEMRQKWENYASKTNVVDWHTLPQSKRKTSAKYKKK